MEKKILFIDGRKGFISQAVINKLENKCFKVKRIVDEVEEIRRHDQGYGIIIFFAYGTDEHIAMIIRYLISLAIDLNKTVCVIGDPDDVATAKSLPYAEKLYSYYERPFDLDDLVYDMQKVIDSRLEFKRKKTVLVVDDDPDFLKVITGWLGFKYNIEGVRSGSEAIRFLDSVRPDLILLDYEMPELDGYQVFDRIRNDPFTYRIPIIFLTGNNDRETVMRILKKKPDGYLLKTTHKDELLDTLNRYFAETILSNKNQ
ncbi:MAG: response regulator [Eubacterium sp.]|nr:response regulator [Eubacterium sp.]